MSAPVDDLMGNPIAEHGTEVELESSGDIEIDVVDDRPEEDRVVRDPNRSSGNDDEIDLVSGSAKGRINKLKYEYHEQRRSKEAAEKMREEAVRYAERIADENRNLKDLLHRGEQVLLNEIKGRASTQLEKARDEYKSAYDAGDTDALLKAQEDLIRSQTERDIADRTSPSVPPPQHNPTPPVPQMDPKLQSWLQKNEWFGQDEEMTSFAYGVHEKLVSKDGVDPRTDDYYQRLDARVKEVFPQKFGQEPESFEVETGTEGPAASPRTNTVVAPANRSSGKPRRVQLTSTQVALAKRLGITPEMYAKQLLKEYSNG